MIDPREALDAWPIPASRTFRPTYAGLNNLSGLVDTPAGSYFIRVYQNTGDNARIRYEHALLLRLQHVGLSFAVPRPLATREGETFVVTAEDRDKVVAALFPVIPGRHPEPGNVARAAACGEALGELDNALACTEVDLRLPTPGMFGELCRVSPLVPDPLMMVEELPLSTEERHRLRALFEDLLAFTPDLYGRLPRQIIHSNLFRGNVLMLGDRVSGVLDFEFASPDLRAMDLAVGLCAFGVPARETGDEWPLIEAFAGGYRRRVALAREEVGALPTLLRLREATALIHWVGQLRRGLTTEDDIARRAEDMLGLDDWLRSQGEELIRRVGNATR
jgi:homoserine kinase type II